LDRKLKKLGWSDNITQYAVLLKEYKKIDQDLTRKHFLPTFNSGKNKTWGPSDIEILYELFKKIELKKDNAFLDLGSGDGRVVTLASLFTKSTGYETSKFLNNIGKRVKKKYDFQANFYNKDFMKADFSNYDVLFIFPDKDCNNPRFLKKIKKEFEGLLIIYKMYPLKFKHKKRVIKEIPIYIYNIKRNL